MSEKKLEQVNVRLRLVDGNGLYSDEQIKTPEDAVRVMAEAMAELDREELCVVNMDSNGHPINFNVVSIGDLNTSMVSAQNVFKSAILSNAGSIIVLHNHPSGHAYASKDDKTVTKKLMYASAFLDIPVIDHIIVAGGTGACYSMLQNDPDIFDKSTYYGVLNRVADGGATELENAFREDNAEYVATNVEGEEDLIDSEERYGIYQITNGGPGEKYRFFGMDFINQEGLEVKGEHYSLVYSDVLPRGENLDSIYRKFNLDRPEDFTGHSLSVSDVIVVQSKEGANAYFVDSFGFTPLPNFMKEREQLLDGVTPEQEKKKESKQREPRKTRKEAVKEITDRLEQGIKELFESERYMDYLKTMSKFHKYSFNNSLLIAMQMPDATLIAGYTDWQKKFHRQVKKGEKAIRILAPAPYKKTIEKEVTNANGQVEKTEEEITIKSFKAAAVFDISQTEGDPLPTIGAGELIETVDGYEDFMRAIKDIAPVPVVMEDIPSAAKGYFSSSEKKIAIQKDMSEGQTMKTAIHELAHSLLDGDETLVEDVEEDKTRTRSDKEVTAESVAFTVANHFGLDTSEYSFGYIAGWSSGKEMKELRNSMERIRKTASQIISQVEYRIHEYRKERVESQEQLQAGNEELYAALDVKNMTEATKVSETVAQYGVEESKILKYPNPFAPNTESIPMTLQISHYVNNNQLFIGLIEMDEEYGPEMYGDITVNLGVECPPYCSFVDTNNLENVEQFVVDNKLGVFTGMTRRSGFCEYPLYQFDPERLRQLEPDGLKQYEIRNDLEKEKDQEQEHELKQEHKKKR